MPPSVSIIMSVANRPNALWRSLTAWSLLDYPEFDFTIIDNWTRNSRIEEIIKEFSGKLHATYVLEPEVTAVNILYNRYGKASKGEYVVFSMMDEIISHGDVLQKMIALSDDRRATLAVSFLDGDQTAALDTNLEWQTNPACLVPKWGPNPAPSSGILAHITGNYRENWEWFGWYQDLPKGHLWLEQDIHIREKCLDRTALTPTDVWCYHQAHPSDVKPDMARPGFHYANEREARLLDKAERDRN